MERSYLTLEKAAKYISQTGVTCSVDDIIHLGSEGKLDIYILLGGFNLTVGCVYRDIKKYGSLSEAQVHPKPKFHKLSRHCLFNIESQKDTDVILEREAIYSYDYSELEQSSMEYDVQKGRFRQQIGYQHFTIYSHGFFTASDIIQLSKTGVYVDTRPVKISDCTMVVLPDELANWCKEDKPEPNASKPQAHEDKQTMRTNDFQAWIDETESDLNAMTWPQIHEALKPRNPHLWSSKDSFDKWKQKQQIHKKPQEGRPRKQR